MVEDLAQNLSRLMSWWSKDVSPTSKESNLWVEFVAVYTWDSEYFGIIIEMWSTPALPVWVGFVFLNYARRSVKLWSTKHGKKLQNLSMVDEHHKFTVMNTHGLFFWFGDVSSRKLFWFVWLLPSKHPPTIQERQFSQTKLDTCQAGERNIHCLGVFWSSRKTQISINSEKHTQIITRAITGFHSEDVVFYINAACNLSEQTGRLWLASQALPLQAMNCIMMLMTIWFGIHGRPKTGWTVKGMVVKWGVPFTVHMTFTYIYIIDIVIINPFRRSIPVVRSCNVQTTVSWQNFSNFPHVWELPDGHQCWNIETPFQGHAEKRAWVLYAGEASLHPGKRRSPPFDRKIGIG